jgi:hypothetical protein
MKMSFKIKAFVCAVVRIDGFTCQRLIVGANNACKLLYRASRAEGDPGTFDQAVDLDSLKVLKMLINLEIAEVPGLSMKQIIDLEIAVPVFCGSQWWEAA